MHITATELPVYLNCKKANTMHTLYPCVHLHPYTLTLTVSAGW